MNNEDKVFAKLIFKFEGKRRKLGSLITIAKQCAELAKKYGSQKEVAQKLGVTYEHVRELLKLLELDSRVQKLVEERKIPYDAAWRLAEIKNKERQKEVANAIINLDTHSGREVVRYSRYNPGKSAQEYVDRLLKSKTTKKEVKLLIIPMDKNKYQSLKIVADREKLSVADLVLKIIESRAK